MSTKQSTKQNTSARPGERDTNEPGFTLDLGSAQLNVGAFLKKNGQGHWWAIPRLDTNQRVVAARQGVKIPAPSATLPDIATVTYEGKSYAIALGARKRYDKEGNVVGTHDLDQSRTGKGRVTLPSGEVKTASVTVTVTASSDWNVTCTIKGVGGASASAARQTAAQDTFAL